MKKIRLGIIGLGSAGLTQLDALASAPTIELFAVAEPGRLRHPVRVAVHTDWRRLLDDAGIDAVSVCLPHHLHAAVALAALQAGKHVLLEKPIAHSAAEARRIIAAANAAKRVLMIEMTHRFYPPVQAGEQLVRSGRLGRVFAVEDRIVQPFPPQYKGGWLLRRKLAGGGVALTNGIHMLDRIRFVCDQPLRFLDGVAGWTQRLGDIEDTASMQLALADGTPVNFLAAWPTHQGKQDDELTIYGTEGTLRIWAWRGWRFDPCRGRAEEVLSYKRHEVVGVVGMSGALSEFASAILRKRAPCPTAEEVLAAHEIIDQFYRRVRRSPH